MSIVPQQQKNFLKKEKKKPQFMCLPYCLGAQDSDPAPPPPRPTHIYTLNYGAHIFGFSGIRESFYIMESKGQRLHERREQTC